MKTRVKINTKPPEDMKPEEVVNDYCSLDFAKKSIDGRLEEIRESTEGIVFGNGIKKTEKTTVYSTADSNLAAEVRKTNKIDGEQLSKVCKRKNIVIGKLNRVIIPKKDIIPDDVLKILDKWFIIEEFFETSPKDVQDALAIKAITQADFNKIIFIKETVALKPTLSNDAMKKVIL